MKVNNFPLRKLLIKGEKFDFEFFEKSFFESPEYQSIQDFQYTFTIYKPLDNKIKIIKAENGFGLRYFHVLDNPYIVSYDHFLNIDNSYLLQITEWKKMNNEMFEQIIKHDILLNEKTLFDKIENINIGDHNILAYKIRLTNNKNFIALLPKSINNILNGVLLKIEDCVPLEFIKAIDMSI